MKLICGNSEELKAVNYIHKRFPSEIFGWVLDSLQL